ncbi:hypothetical protein Geob_3908 [Geotalea daltonii FRC-32]|uniref:Uncharacterized protein n=1 Tax=Geotalea daltonii (strain DSM 22248 / JCM 15807 / FRC-32) TaxID=316067 RepID=A0A068F139_GEODF|nr:hypothetical protein [Geotalea daltonii]AID58011.1 hypothetical protein Geob_3908 [Geotalea daltonii FRC-32]
MKVKAKQEVHNHILDQFDNKNIKPNETYDVIGIDHDCFRIVDQVGDPILYPKYLFEIIDSSIPQSWIRKEYEADEYYIDPPEFSEPGFYEDLFDGDSKAIDIYEKYLASVGITRKFRGNP